MQGFCRIVTARIARIEATRPKREVPYASEEVKADARVEAGT
jgi:hypothetical protein